MHVDSPAVTVVVDWSLRAVATIVPPLLDFELVTRSQGISLGVIFLSLFAASIVCSWFANRSTPPSIDDDQT